MGFSSELTHLTVLTLLLYSSYVHSFQQKTVGTVERRSQHSNIVVMAENKPKVIWNENAASNIPNWRQAPKSGVKWNENAYDMGTEYDGNFLSEDSQNKQAVMDEPSSSGAKKNEMKTNSSTTSRIQWNANVEDSLSPSQDPNTENNNGLNPYDSGSRIQWNVNTNSNTVTSNLKGLASTDDGGKEGKGVEGGDGGGDPGGAFGSLLDACAAATDASVAAFGKGGGATGSSEWHGFRTDAALLQACEDALAALAPAAPTPDARAAWAWLLASPRPLRVDLETNGRFALHLSVVPPGRPRPPPHNPQSGALLLTTLLAGKIDQVKYIVGSDGSYREVSTVSHPKFDEEKVWKTFAGSSRQMVNSDGHLLGDRGAAVFLDAIFYPPGKEVFGYDTGAAYNAPNKRSAATYPEHDGATLLAAPPCPPGALFAAAGSPEASALDVLSLQSSATSPQQKRFKAPRLRKFANDPSDDEPQPETSKEWIKDLSVEVGGLEDELQEITRRVLASRTLPPVVRDLAGIRHVRGLLLYGPPGCGKTLIARELAARLDARPPKLVSGPELLDKWVGEAERNVRRLFLPAEEELERCLKAGGNPLDLPLHVICFDEIDALIKRRGSLSGDTSGVRDSVVNQLLSKIDGLRPLDNVLVVGMTNRLELLDEAMLRPGRFEVVMRIPEPDAAGRRQILGIHLKAAAAGRRLAADVDVDYLARKTHKFSGAHLAGLVRAATSYAIERWQVEDQATDVTGEALTLRMEDFRRALPECGPLAAKERGVATRRRARRGASSSGRRKRDALYASVRGLGRRMLRRRGGADLE